MKNILLSIKEIINSGKKAALCIIIETKGSSPRKTGSKMIVFEDGSQEGTIGGGSLELKVIDDALEVITKGIPAKFSYELDDDLSMNCGGDAEVYIEPVLPQQQLFIFGSGHIGKALVRYAPDFGFAITIIDNREGLDKEFDQNKIRFLNIEYIEAAKEIEFTEQSFIVIVTPKHAYDEDVLAICAKKQFAYLGMIGSKNKVALARKRMLSENILTEEELDKVDMPIGIKFNAQTPEEIAISILAKLIDRKNRKNL
ncbi:MAG: XdhC family protein [Bacteroidetes bacterium]|nr:XdhC family protein [Bacteroidota bacterium]MBL7104806.1 XdhC family protein [Bacteroidales bacterium]